MIHQLVVYCWVNESIFVFSGVFVEEKYTLLSISNTSISNARLKLPRNQAKAKQDPEAELCYFKIIHVFHQRYHAKIIEHIIKDKQKNKCVDMRTINHNENEDENTYI